MTTKELNSSIFYYHWSLSGHTCQPKWSRDGKRRETSREPGCGHLVSSGGCSDRPLQI